MRREFPEETNNYERYQSHKDDFRPKFREDPKKTRERKKIERIILNNKKREIRAATDRNKGQVIANIFLEMIFKLLDLDEQFIDKIFKPRIGFYTQTSRADGVALKGFAAQHLQARNRLLDAAQELLPEDDNEELGGGSRNKKNKKNTKKKKPQKKIIKKSKKLNKRKKLK